MPAPSVRPAWWPPRGRGPGRCSGAGATGQPGRRRTPTGWMLWAELTIQMSGATGPCRWQLRKGSSPRRMPR